ncbi:recombinase family protein [Anaerobacillus arseniciselenatis]|uniref:Recombinase family protein n=1 Tax=Anaerobacillus arseniciselenatis TaxID=85682 RepID=A0A1S2LMQ0_9BACI|nr:recombinase family protein [Anaerobacillus arseniciselenatis]OIJ12957.1 recombinase family protein [Anaerobacillus arseniciselenatis]
MNTTMISKGIKHVAMYLRISQEKKSEGIETLTNHRNLLSDYAKNNGYTYEAFEEVLSGGASEIEKRPQLQKLLGSIEKYDAILVVELSRLSRNGLISETVLQYCKDYDKPIVTPEKVFDLANNDNDVLTFRFGSLIASQEHSLIGKRSKNNKIQMAKQGLHVSGSVPMGYRRNPKTKRLEIYEPEAKTIKYIFKLHAKGLGAFRIRDILNEEGYKSATGKHFSLPSVRRIIKNETYKGTLIFNDRKRIKKNGKFTHEIVDTIRVENVHPSIVSPEEWDAVNKDRKERAEKSAITREKPAIKSGVTMLKDLVFCSVCGSKMFIRKDNKSGTGYTLKKCEYLLDNGEKCCNAGIKLNFIEKGFIEKVQNYKTELESLLVKLDAEDTTQIKEGHHQRLLQIEKRIKEIEPQQKELLNLALAGIYTHDEIREKKQELTDLLTSLNNQRETVLKQISSVSIEDEKSKIQDIIKTIDKIEQIEDVEGINAELKTIIKKVHYERVIPEELLKKSTQNPERKYYPFLIRIEYY